MGEKVQEKAVVVTVLLRGWGNNREEIRKKYIVSLGDIHTKCYRTTSTNGKGTNE